MDTEFQKGGESVLKFFRRMIGRSSSKYIEKDMMVKWIDRAERIHLKDSEPK